MSYWAPETEAELLTAITSRTVDESHFLDFKRESGTNDSARKETAADIASFAIDGGVLIFGVDEPTPGVFSAAPIKLESLSERVEQIAANRVEPGISVRTRAIPSSADPAVGFLVVEIAPSPAAPHMVDGRYYARGEKTKRRLGDAEVLRFHLNRRETDERVDAALEEERVRHPLARLKVGEGSGRLFLVAEPLTAPPGLARPLLEDHNQILRVVTGADAWVPNDVRQWAPGTEYLQAVDRRSAGIACTNFGEGRTEKPGEDPGQYVDVELQFSGTVRATVSGMISEGERGGPQVFLRSGAAIAWAHRLVGMTRIVARESGYRGSWGLGYHLDDLQGRTALVPNSWGRRFPTFDAPSYRATTVASFAELEDTPAMVVGRLAGDLALAFGVHTLYAEVLGAPARS